jgi:serine/threonine-protein kinase
MSGEKRLQTTPLIPIGREQLQPGSHAPPVPQPSQPALPPAPPSQPHGNYGSLPPPPPSFGAIAPLPNTAGFVAVHMPQPGTTLSSARGNYLVRSVIGSGVFGAVFECVGPFDQIYAVKVIRPANRPYADVRREWESEVRRLMSLRHPNVVYIYDAFEEKSLFFLALERCDHPLHAMLGARMQEGLVIELARQLLAAVQFLHDNDIVHDDLHPGNVLISQLDRPIVKISDFGISHELRGAAAIRPNVVHHHIMAPEVVAAGYTSKQSDLYQVGLLLYWMLTGEPAIPHGLPYQELVRTVADGEPRKRAERLGTPLGDTISKLLRRRDAYRYTSAREVWADLREHAAWRQHPIFQVR